VTLFLKRWDNPATNGNMTKKTSTTNAFMSSKQDCTIERRGPEHTQTNNIHTHTHTQYNSIG
jgi:hypothetical protein